MSAFLIKKKKRGTVKKIELFDLKKRRKTKKRIGPFIGLMSKLSLDFNREKKKLGINPPRIEKKKMVQKGKIRPFGFWED
jgi:hypothetical protein